MTGSAPTPQAMTLEEALWALQERKRHLVPPEPGTDSWGVVEVTLSPAHEFGSWPEATSHALGYPVVERDPTAELVEAVEAWAKAYSRAYDEPLGPSEVDDAVWQFDRAEADLLAALARHRGES